MRRISRRRWPNSIRIAPFERRKYEAVSNSETRRDDETRIDLSVFRSFRRTPRQSSRPGGPRPATDFAIKDSVGDQPPTSAAVVAHDLLMLAIGRAHHPHTVSLLHA